MSPQVLMSSKVFLTLSTWIQLSSNVFSTVQIQTIFPCKPFVTQRTQIRSWLVIMWKLTDITTISFNLHLKTTFTCTQNIQRPVLCYLQQQCGAIKAIPSSCFCDNFSKCFSLIYQKMHKHSIMSTTKGCESGNFLWNISWNLFLFFRNFLLKISHQYKSSAWM